MFVFASPRARRKPSLTPMIDVVFLLLVFFMLASRFGSESAFSLDLAGPAVAYEGPPRLLEIAPDGLALNGVALEAERLAEALARLSPNPHDDVIVLRARDGASLQRVVAVMEALELVGFRRLVLVQ
jgi:biopolymer transport protein ExbD